MSGVKSAWWANRNSDIYVKTNFNVRSSYDNSNPRWEKFEEKEK